MSVGSNIDCWMSFVFIFSPVHSDALVTVRVPLTKLLAEHENDNADNERVQQLLKEISAVQSLSE